MRVSPRLLAVALVFVLGSLAGTGLAQCIDQDRDGFGAAGSTACRRSGLDCDDSDPSVSPGAPEQCDNGRDENCDGTIDLADLDCLRPDAVVFRGPDRLEWTPVAGATGYAVGSGEVGRDPWCLGGRLETTSVPVPERPQPGHALYYVVHGTTTDADTGTIRNGGVCGDQVYVDPAATGAGTGMSWRDAYTTITAATRHSGDSWKELQVFVTGSIDEFVDLPLSWSRQLALYGGFSGSERHFWERRPINAPTPWAGGLRGFPGTSGRLSLTVDGFDITESGLEAREAFDSGRVRVVRTRFSAGAQLRVVPFESYFTTEVAGCVFEGLGVRFRPYSSIAEFTVIGSRFEEASFDVDGLAESFIFSTWLKVDLLGNRFSGGAEGVRLAVWMFENTPHPALIEGLISGNVFDDVEAPIALDATIEHRRGDVREIRLRPRIVGNTIHRARGDAVTCALRSFPWPPWISEAHCEPELVDNIVAASAGYAVREPADDPASGEYSNFTMIGNLLFGNGELYFDGSTGPIDTIADLNARPLCADNFAADPRFVNAAAGDVHLSAGSPAIDRGHPGSGCWIRDMDLRFRGKDGDGNGLGEDDVGADEFPGN